jgi:hypothetical protein
VRRPHAVTSGGTLTRLEVVPVVGACAVRLERLAAHERHDPGDVIIFQMTLSQQAERPHFFVLLAKLSHLPLQPVRSVRGDFFDSAQVFDLTLLPPHRVGRVSPF